MSSHSSVAFLTLAGELDIGAKTDLVAALAKLETADIAILDFTNVAFCDSSAIGSILGMRGRMLKAGSEGVVRVVGASAATRRVFAICGLDRVFSLHDDLRSAGIEAFGGDCEVTFVGSYSAGSIVVGDELQITRANSSALIA